MHINREDESILVTLDLVGNKEFKIDKNRNYHYSSEGLDYKTYIKIDKWFNYHIIMFSFPSLGEFLFSDKTPDEYQTIDFDEFDNIAELMYKIDDEYYYLGDKEHIDYIRKSILEDNEYNETGYYYSYSEIKTFERDGITYYLCLEKRIK